MRRSSTTGKSFLRWKHFGDKGDLLAHIQQLAADDDLISQKALTWLVRNRLLAGGN